MARRTNYTFNKKQKEKEKAKRAERKRERRLERKEAEENGTIQGDPDIIPIDPADLGLGS